MKPTLSNNTVRRTLNRYWSEKLAMSSMTLPKWHSKSKSECLLDTSKMPSSTQTCLDDIGGSYMAHLKQLNECEFLQHNEKGESDIELNVVAFLSRVNEKAGMVDDGQLEGSPITWKTYTESKRTFMTEKSYRNILPDSRPLLRIMETKFVNANGSSLNTL
ncbi:unnamed protein product [Mytilus coruscus]|uniref:Uncharacterized protein n=1 Tax=Mytilus coruscus TaxID=42192 RepID=A0A6J8D3J7_MYTCO|nr:unnamed protein product [Mytilus coruscus]